MDCSPPGSSIHGIFQARVLEWGATAFSLGTTTVVKFIDMESRPGAKEGEKFSLMEFLFRKIKVLEIDSGDDCTTL